MNGLSEKELQIIRAEVDMIKGVKHASIVSLQDLFEDEGNLYMVFEYLSSTLFDRISRRTFYNEMEARDAMIRLLTAVKYFHDNNIVHRDIRPEHIMLVHPDSDSYLKVVDFGSALRVPPNEMIYTDPPYGCMSYFAPEVLKLEPYNSKVDIWCVGVVMYILFCGHTPYRNSHIASVLEDIKRGELNFCGEIWEKVSEEVKDLISHLLQVDPNVRYDANMALQHPWMLIAGKTLQLRRVDNIGELLRYQAIARPCKLYIHIYI